MVRAAVAANDTKASKGSKLYAGCIACHGAKGEGGIGPSFKGSKVIISPLLLMNIRIR